MNNTSFVKPISEEKKRLKDLKFNIYIKGYVEQHKGKWASIITNTKGDKNTLIGDSNNATDERMELYSVLESFKHIFQSLEDKDKKFCKLFLYTESIYIINVLKEWIHLWKKERFINRPNGDLLNELLYYINICNLNLNFISYTNSSIESEFNTLLSISK